MSIFHHFVVESRLSLEATLSSDVSVTKMHIIDVQKYEAVQ
jgi:hypothetical protein